LYLITSYRSVCERHSYNFKGIRSVLRHIDHYHGCPQKVFQGGGNVYISLILFQVANDAMKIDLHKTSYPFYTTKKISHESTRSVRIFLKSYTCGVVFEFGKCYTFCHPLQLLLNWGIIQYHYFCELPIAESELDVNDTELRSQCSHKSVWIEAHLSKFCIKCFLHFGCQKCILFS